MKKIIVLLLSISSVTLYAQNFDTQVCDCIERNFKEVQLDFSSIMDQIEDNLVSNTIIQRTPESRVEQIKHVAQYGYIESKRSIDHVSFEQLGLRTIRYCIYLHSYGSKDEQGSEYFRLMKSLDILNQNTQQPIDLNKIRKATASTILTYAAKENRSQLWRIIQLTYLYLFSDIPNIGLIELDFNEVDTIQTNNIITIHTNADNEISFNDEPITVDELCERIKKPVERGFSIHLTNHRNTKYKVYLAVYNGIKQCIQELREEKSLELYQKHYSNLNKEQESEIKKLLPIKLFESNPDE